MSRVYLVDDHALLRDGLRLVLEKNGHQVIGEATDLTRAASEVRELNPDVVVLDLHLAGRSGIEMLEELQKRKSSTRCVVLTMSSQARNVADCLRYGASAYLLKGGPPHELLVAINHALNGRTYLGEGVSALMVAAPPEGDGLASLSARERQIAVLVVQGHSSNDVGRLLHLSPKTVDTYRSRLMAKLGTPDLPALVRYAMSKGLIEPE
jgi:two-component system invasion response regulator UvrY